MNRFNILYKKVMAGLKENLPDYLTYHDIEHTKLVLEKTIFIAGKEGISTDELTLLKTAAVYHDTGYRTGNMDHETESCRIARQELPELGYTEAEIEQICGMIMATKIPQEPNNQLERIIADADLEYMGTSRFGEISGKLFLELKHFNPMLSIKEWLDIQINFMGKHTYHTSWCKRYREPVKRKNLEKLKNLRENLIPDPRG
jgi:uncharacterized protein